jgi:hypothetical protein
MMDGWQMSPRTLRAGGVKLMWTEAQRLDLLLIPPAPGEAPSSVNTYEIRHAAPRCEFFGLDRVRFASETDIHRLLRDQTFALDATLLLPDSPRARPAAQADGATSPTTQLNAELRYRRPTTDDIVVSITTNQPGYARILESWDTGWQATVDGAPAPVLAGDDVFLAVPIPKGKHDLRLSYHTDGAAAGAGISIISTLMLGGWSISWGRGSAARLTREAR